MTNFLIILWAALIFIPLVLVRIAYVRWRDGSRVGPAGSSDAGYEAPIVFSQYDDNSVATPRDCASDSSSSSDSGSSDSGSSSCGGSDSGSSDSSGSDSGGSSSSD